MGDVGTGVQTLYYVLAIIFMLGGVVAAYVKALQLRIGRQERDLVDYNVASDFTATSTLHGG
jgi:hypothetical protein